MPAKARHIDFKSYVSAERRAELEGLVFFNSYQTRVWDGIVDAVEKFGPPEIVSAGARLRVCLRNMPDVQCLFAVDRESSTPIGVAVYMRPDHEHIIVLHIGVAEEFASGGQRADEQLLLRLLREVRRCSRRVKGVRHIELFYVSGRQARRPRSRLVRERA
jgi:hypothetical protein